MGLGYGAAVNSIRAAITFTVAEQNLKRVSFPPSAHRQPVTSEYAAR